LDFIERYLGLAFDSGDSSLERAILLLLFVVTGLAGVGLAFVRKPERDRRK